MSKSEKLGEISNISLGRDFRGKVPVVPNGEILVIQPKDVFSESIEKAAHVTPKEAGAINDRLLHPGDILCSTRHKFVSMVVKDEWLRYEPVIANSGLFIIRLTRKDYLPEYVSAFINCFFEREKYQYMLEEQKQEKIKNGKKPSVNLLTKDDLSFVSIPKKGLEEQREIAAEIRKEQSRYHKFIDSLNEEKIRIENKYKQVNKEYSQVMEAVYNSVIAE